MYKEKVIDRIPEKMGLVKWEKPILLYVNDKGHKSHTSDFEARLKAYKKISGIEFLMLDKSDGANWVIDIVDAPRPANHNNQDFFSMNIEQIDGHIQHVDMKFWHFDFNNSVQQGESRDTAPLARQMVISGLGLPVPFDFTFGLTRDKSLSRYKTSETLLAIHYDKRLKAGSSHDEIRNTVGIITNEIERAPSFDDWLETSKNQ